MGLEALADLPARMLSAGQKRRLALARLALSRAPLWLLDEPTLGLDARSIERFGGCWRASRRRRDGGRGNPRAAAAAGRRAGRCGSDWEEAAMRHLAAARPVPRPAAFAAARRRHPGGAAVLPGRPPRCSRSAIGPAPETLGRIAPGIVWVCALLAALLPLDRLFGADFEDGSLDQLLLSGLPPAAIAVAKAASHWLVTGLAAAAGRRRRSRSCCACQMRRCPHCSLGLLPGTLLLSLLGTIGAAIVLGARRGGVLLPLLVLPLATPVLIFGAAAADAASGGLSPALICCCSGAVGSGIAAVSPRRGSRFAQRSRINRNHLYPTRVFCVIGISVPRHAISLI